MRADVVSLIWCAFEVKVDDIQTVPTSLDHLNHLRLNEVSPLEHLMATFDQFVSSIRQEFGEQSAGKKFEVFCKWFLENDPEWSKKVDKVWLWDDYPNKWQRQDLGTDLVFRDNEGLIWAAQT
jgi:hypothetical protein